MLEKDRKLYIQKANGNFLYLDRCVYSTILTALSSIASQQSNPTEATKRRMMQLVDYIATQEEAIITYSASNMVLTVHSNASYLSKPNAQSQARGHFFMSTDTIHPPNNGDVLNITQIIKNVMSSAAKAELSALYIMARETIHIRNILAKLGHKSNRARQSKQTTRQLRLLSTTRFNPSKPKPWTCASIGCATVTSKNNSARALWVVT